MREKGEKEGAGRAGHPYLPIKSPDEKINTQETDWGAGGGREERGGGRRRGEEI